MEKHIGCGFNKISIGIESIDIESPVNEKIKEKNKNDIEINNENTEEIKEEKNIKRKTKKPKTLKKTVIDMIN